MVLQDAGTTFALPRARHRTEAPLTCRANTTRQRPITATVRRQFEMTGNILCFRLIRLASAHSCNSSNTSEHASVRSFSQASDGRLTSFHHPKLQYYAANATISTPRDTSRSLHHVRGIFVGKGFSSFTVNFLAVNDTTGAKDQCHFGKQSLSNSSNNRLYRLYHLVSHKLIQ
jgi:hypothetical protein